MTRDELIETMARAICGARFWEGAWPPADDGVRRSLLVDAKAALTAIESAGMRVVPAVFPNPTFDPRIANRVTPPAQEDSTSE